MQLGQFLYLVSSLEEITIHAFSVLFSIFWLKFAGLLATGHNTLAFLGGESWDPSQNDTYRH